MGRSRLAVQVICSYFDQVVEDVVTPTGQSIILGGTDVMAVPKPEGKPYLCQLTWTSPDRVVVESPEGETQVLGREGTVAIEDGAVRIELRLIPRYRLQRLASWATMYNTAVSLLVLTVLIASVNVGIGQVTAAREVWCMTWLSTIMPCEASASAQEGAGDGMHGNSDRVAEYLEFILKNQPGDQEVARLDKGDRQTGERENDSFYLPAGDSGNPDRMGGADDVGLRPVRSVTQAKEEPKVQKKEEQPLVSPVGSEVDIPMDPVDVVDADAAEDGEEVPEDAEVLKEDREGWGFRDWYDQADKEMDELEVETMTKVAKRVLFIDPNDREALGLLAYYQYLGENFIGATQTYDRMIELAPEDAGTYNNKALIYKRLKQYKKEEALYDIALSLDPDDVTVLNNLAVNYAHQNRFDEALATMERLEVLDPGEPYADLHRAKIYAAMGDDEKAYALLEQALTGMKKLDTLHHIEFRQDIRVDPAFEKLRKTRRFHEIMDRFYGEDSPVQE